MSTSDPALIAQDGATQTNDNRQIGLLDAPSLSAGSRSHGRRFDIAAWALVLACLATLAAYAGERRMSLCIDETRVTAVLLADGWHEAYDFMSEGYEVYDGRGVMLHDGVTHFSFTDGRGDEIYGPLASVLAVRYAEGGAS